VREVRLAAGLFAQDPAVPGEVDLLDHRIAVGRQPLFGDATSQGVVTVPPPCPVRGGHRREVVLGVPLVAPSVGFAGEAGLLPQGDAAEGVVLEADAAGAREGGAGVGTRSGGPLARARVGPGSRALVADGVVDVALGPAVCVDCGDPADRVEVERAGARHPVADGEQVAVGAVGVGAGVHGACSGGDVLLGEPSGHVPCGGHGEGIAKDAGELTAGGVVGEVDVLAAGGQAVRCSVGPIGVGGDLAGGGGATGAAAEDVVGVGEGAAVHELGLDVSAAVVLVAQVAVGSDCLQQAARLVVGAGGDFSVAVLADRPAERVTLEGEALAEGVDPGGEVPGGVVAIGESAAVEVGLGDGVADRVVLVAPGQSLRVGDAGEAQIGI